MAKSKSRHKGKGGGKPRGATYADVLAHKMAIQKGLEKYGADQAMQIEADIQTQRAMWLMVCSIADAFKIGPERMKRDFFPALQANSEELERMRKEDGDDYAYEKLKHRAGQVTGIEIDYMYEHELREAGLKLAEDGGYAPMTQADQIRNMSDEELADMLTTGRGGFDCSTCRIGDARVCDMECKLCCVEWLKKPCGAVQIFDEAPSGDRGQGGAEG